MCCGSIPISILAGPFGVRGTVDLLQRLGRRVVIVPQPQELAGVRAAVRDGGRGGG